MSAETRKGFVLLATLICGAVGGSSGNLWVKFAAGAGGIYLGLTVLRRLH